ncbi:MAG TPA: beta-propeller fold lactonase family protein [Gemmatimonadaceae bacterium]|nr:beta-propeller fold lactonase family protein [Gemmatimonadaceae bacterium]
MQIILRSRRALLALTGVTLAACAADDRAPTVPQLDASAVAASRGQDVGDEEIGGNAPGAVYTETNGAAGNAILAFRRATDGTLTPLGAVSTGGLGIGGTADPLMSQYAIVLRADHRVLYAVNAGSNDVSAFRVGPDGSITLASRVASGGVTPVSLATRGELLFALNSSSNTVQGFRATPSGGLTPVPGASTTLLPGASGASSIKFSADGEHLLVTERNSNRLETIAVGKNGRLGTPVATASSGAVPFAVDLGFDGSALVAEAGGAAPNGAVSSYQLGGAGTLRTVTASLSTQGAATCWLVATPDGRFAYAINSASSTVTGLSVAQGGRLSLLNVDGVTASTGTSTAPIDPALADGGRFLYVLKAGTGTIQGFRVAEGHELVPQQDVVAGAPRNGQQGLAAF